MSEQKSGDKIENWTVIRDPFQKNPFFFNKLTEETSVDVPEPLKRTALESLYYQYKVVDLEKKVDELQKRVEHLENQKNEKQGLKSNVQEIPFDHPKVICGSIRADGSVQTSWPENSFKVQKTGDGEYIIHFFEKFERRPTCVVTQRYNSSGGKDDFSGNCGNILDNAVIIAASTERLKFSIGNSGGKKCSHVNRNSEFIAIGK